MHIIYTAMERKNQPTQFIVAKMVEEQAKQIALLLTMPEKALRNIIFNIIVFLLAAAAQL